MVSLFKNKDKGRIMSIETDVQELAKQVKQFSVVKVNTRYNDDDSWLCALCGAEVDEYTRAHKNTISLENFPHKPGCAWLIAKDLLTGTEIKLPELGDIRQA